MLHYWFISKIWIRVAGLLILTENTEVPYLKVTYPSFNLPKANSIRSDRNQNKSLCTDIPAQNHLTYSMSYLLLSIWFFWYFRVSVSGPFTTWHFMNCCIHVNLIRYSCVATCTHVSMCFVICILFYTRLYSLRFWRTSNDPSRTSDSKWNIHVLSWQQSDCMNINREILKRQRSPENG